MARAFALHDFLATLPDAPNIFDNTSGILDWGMMENDKLGDCTCATGGHLIQAWTAASGREKEVTVPDAAVQTAYEKACGYVPGVPSTDQGGEISAVLEYFRNVGIGGYKISAHAEVNLTQLRVQQAMYVFGAIDLGIALPMSAQAQVGGMWDIVDNQVTGAAAPGSWGGHSVPAVYYSPRGVDVVTWGAIQAMTWRFFMYYVDEAHACISPDYSQSPVPVNQLVADLAEAGS
jgi:hypothetical protein